MQNFEAYTQFHRLCEQRRSCREYQSTPLDRSTLLAVLDAGRLAPSAVNRQPVRYIVLDAATDPEARDIICQVYPRPWIATAPVYIVVVGLHNEAWHRGYDNKDHTDVDAAIATEHICLAAAAMGLGSCWVCNFDAAKLTELLNLPEGQEPIAIIPIGYPADTDAPRRGRKSLDETVQWGR